MSYLYIKAPCTGKGFITHLDRENIQIMSGQPCDIMVTTDNQAAIDWCTRVDGTLKTRDEALALWLVQFNTTKSGMLEEIEAEKNTILATTFSGYVDGITASLEV